MEVKIMTVKEMMQVGFDSFDVLDNDVLNERAFRKKCNKAGYRVTRSINKNYQEVLRITKK